MEQLFVKESVLEHVLGLQSSIKSKIKELKDVISLSEEPSIEMGRHCYNPYDCDYIGYCTKADTFSHCVPIDEVVNIDIGGIKDFLSELEYPLYYMDFETYMLAIPEYDGHWPYRQVPFQFSLHVESANRNTIKHHQFIANPGTNPVKDFIDTLLSNIGAKGSILVYNKTFENTRLKELKKEFPEYEMQITDVQNRMIDLMLPFRRKYYDNSALEGSYSIKAVLPVVVPEMSYENLNITNGADASTIYYNLRNATDETYIEQTMTDLFEYCKLDTLAMVKILNELKKMV